MYHTPPADMQVATDCKELIVVLGFTARTAVTDCSRRPCRALVYSRHLKVFDSFIWIMKLTLLNTELQLNTFDEILQYTYTLLWK